MGWLIGIAVAVLGGFVVWAFIQKNQKEKAIRARDQAIENSIAVENKLENVKDNVDKVLDYNTKDIEAKKKIDIHIKKLQGARKDKEVINELAKIRADIHDVLSTL